MISLSSVIFQQKNYCAAQKLHILLNSFSVNFDKNLLIKSRPYITYLNDVKARQEIKFDSFLRESLRNTIVYQITQCFIKRQEFPNEF